ncbi:MAG: hypothetical protein CSA81_08955 [Acidobacteria bacterium]|nr:MAG: hypothetical protein CSA81_08955 [Acidobacteriota bacterium]
MEHQCIFCKSRLCIPVNMKHSENWKYVLCQNCSTTQLCPTPSQEILAQAYSDTYYGPRKTKFIGPVESLIQTFRRMRAKSVTKVIPGKGSLLDIGCGNGEFLAMLKDSYDCHGVELPGKQAERAMVKLGDKIKVGKLNTSDFKKNSLDAVTMWHVFEHLTQPGETLSMIDCWLKPGGYLFLSLPNIDSWQAGIFQGNWLHLDPPRHLFFQNQETIQRNLESKGYRLIRVKHLSFEQNIFGYIQSALNLLMKPRDLFFHFLQGILPRQKHKVLLSGLAAVLLFPFAFCLTLLEAMVGKGGTIELIFRKAECHRVKEPNFV